MSNIKVHETIREEEAICRHLIGKVQDEHKAKIMLTKNILIHRGGKCVIIRIVIFFF